MSCNDVQAKLAPYLGERLPAGAAGAVRAHLAACAACRGALDEQSALREALTRGVTEASEDATLELLAGARRRLEQVATRRGWRRPFAAVAAAILVSLGLMGWHIGPCLWGECPSARALAGALALVNAPARPLTALGIAPGSADAPDLTGLNRVGGDLLTDGVTVVRYTCLDADVLLIRAPGVHLHMWDERSLADGQSYSVGEIDGVQRVVWLDARGRLWCCVGPPGDRLLAVATTVRSST